MWEWIKMEIRENLIFILLRVLSLYFFIVFHLNVGFPPSQKISSEALLYLSFSIFFFLIPLAKKISIGKFIEYEAKINEIKTDVKEFKEETREIIRVYNNIISTVSNTVKQSVTVNLPERDEVEQARDELDSTIEQKAEPAVIEGEIDYYLQAEGNDLNYALAKLRMDIERELRRILGKRLESEQPLNMRGKFLSARSLFREFSKKQPKYNNMYGSFDYMLKICNAAIHGQEIPHGHAHDALYMGIRMLDELKNIKEL